MKIGIDVSQIVYGTGVSFYTSSLVENLLKIDKTNEYRLLAGTLRQSDFFKNYFTSLEDFKNAKGKIALFPPSLADLFSNRLHLLPVESFLGKIDVFHSSDWSQPPTKAARITTIHDFGFLKFPATAHPKIKSVMARRLKWVKKEADMIIAISESTKKDIMEILNIPEQKIKVVYEAAPDDVIQIKDQKKINQIKDKYKLDGDFLLSVATLEPRKNLKRIILAFQKIKKDFPSMKLVIAGKSGWDQGLNEIIRQKQSDIVFTGYINRDDLLALYSSTSCFVFPSLYEGFGLPILEAMKCGAPVVTSNVSSMPEVTGQAGVLVDPLSVEKIAQGIKKAIGDKESLMQKGFKQADSFSWEKTAKETLKVYKQAVQNK